MQGSSKSDWSDVRMLKTKLVGYNKPGALYDPLVNGETVGSIGGSGNITWVPGQGIRMNDQRAYVVYTLPQVYSSGEISAEVTGLGPGGSPGKGRIFSILDRLGVLASSAHHSINVQYRGVGGAPDNCIAWKAILGDNDQLGRAKHDPALSIGVHPRPVEGVPLAGLLDANLGEGRREGGRRDGFRALRLPGQR